MPPVGTVMWRDTMSGGVDVSDKSLLIHPSAVVIAAAALVILTIETLLLKGSGRRVAPSEDKGEVEEVGGVQIDGILVTLSGSHGTGPRWTWTTARLTAGPHSISQEPITIALMDD